MSAAPGELLSDRRALIDQAHDATARAVNSALVLLHWNIGDRVRRDSLKRKRAEHSEQILPTLSAKLVPVYGQGFGEQNLGRTVAMAEVFPDGAEQVELLHLGAGGVRVGDRRDRVAPENPPRTEAPRRCGTRPRRLKAGTA